MATPVSEIYDFINYTIEKSFLNNNTAGSRRTACNNLFELLGEDQKTVEYVSDNLDSIVHRLKNKYPTKFTGNTIEVYKSRVKNTVDDFNEWKMNRSAWEKKITSKSKTAAPRLKPEAQSKQGSTHDEKFQNRKPDDSETQNVRRMAFPVRSDFEVKVEIPKEGLTIAELRRLGIFLFPYCKDFSPEKAAEWGLVASRD